jgi:hypothetical protein
MLDLHLGPRGSAIQPALMGCDEVLQGDAIPFAGTVLQRDVAGQRGKVFKKSMVERQRQRLP